MSKTKTGLAGLTLGALGVVFGDIGTSPLYALQAVFGPLGLQLAATRENVLGIISLVIWSIILVVCIKYVGFIMRAENRSEGGMLALVALIKSGQLPAGSKALFIFLGLIGVALFYGDSVITPAISVLSAVEGLKAVSPLLSPVVIPLTLVLLAGVFWVQKYGTAVIGRLFGPVMLTWFVVIGLAGGWRVWQHPEVLAALSPLSAVTFWVGQPLVAFLAMAAVVLTVTGVEALYTDMGHFGRKPIARAWFWLVFPALVLCYMGQGALMLAEPANINSVAGPFMSLFPPSLRIPAVILATVAAMVASQAIISGAFSLTRQAVQLGFLPRMQINHTSIREVGQIYIPFINMSLFTVVVLLVIGFGSSAKMAGAYGLAVSGTMAIDTILFLVVARTLWRKSATYIGLAAVTFLAVDLLFLAATFSKIPTGAWFTLAVASLLLVIIMTWQKGQIIVSRKRRAMEGPLQDFIDTIHDAKPPIVRVPGNAVYIGHHPSQAPLALHAAVETIHELHERVVIVTVRVITAAHVPEDERAVFDPLAYDDGISQLRLTYGFHDHINIPRTLQSLRHLSPELDFDPGAASYFVSQSKVVPNRRPGMSSWRKGLYALLSRNALSASDYYRLPVEHTIEMRSLIKL